MKIITCCKVVPDEEQIKVLPNRELALDDVPAKISQYDLNALEAAKKLSAETKGSVTALSVGSATITASLILLKQQKLLQQQSVSRKKLTSFFAEPVLPISTIR